MERFRVLRNPLVREGVTEELELVAGTVIELDPDGHSAIRWQRRGVIVPEAEAEAMDLADAATEVECPKCGAEPGESCVTPSGNETKTHAARAAAATE